MKFNLRGMAPISVITFFLVVISLSTLVIAGWVQNISKLLEMLGGDITAMLVVRIVGIPFAPLGVILGWFY